VVLAPESTYVPVEPMPEHKIVVEFTGQWQDNSASLYLGKTETQKTGSVSKPSRDLSNAHRSLATFNSLELEAKSLYLSIQGRGRPEPMRFLLAENLIPVDKDTDMPEWDNVLVPVVPMHYTNGAKDKAKSKLYTKGYIYIFWKGKAWRELEVTEKDSFREVDLEYHRETQPATRIKTRHVDITLADEDGTPYSFAPFEIQQKGKKIFNGTLDVHGQARIFGLQDEEVDVLLPEISSSVRVATTESPSRGGKIVYREAEGFPMPHIWLPYKIAGEVQDTLYAVHRTKQLSLSELSKLEDNHTESATQLTGLASYSDMQAFDPEETTISSLVLPTDNAEHPKNYRLISSQLEDNIAAAYLSPPGGFIEFRYHINDCKQFGASDDQLDDYFEMRDSRLKDMPAEGDSDSPPENTEGEEEKPSWTERVYLRQCDDIEVGVKGIRFNGWPGDVKEVDLVRSHKRGSETDNGLLYIYKNVPVTDF